MTRTAGSLPILYLTLTVPACSMTTMMLNEQVSPCDLDTTVDTMKSKAEKMDGVVSGSRDMGKSIAEQGVPDIGGQTPIVKLHNAQMPAESWPRNRNATPRRSCPVRLRLKPSATARHSLTA